ncbi:hypothetical protein JHD48_01540 [Sulfurimonas sp. SAG-AH-194-I05]|nr:hypothetical protein [Sulfurimonas sp. SAG-AH-194-I05]MDF1874410.1 hypothetical protein [Sulfurimonas sp. SAG-AH-194-I05]
MESLKQKALSLGASQSEVDNCKNEPCLIKLIARYETNIQEECLEKPPKKNILDELSKQWIPEEKPYLKL